MIRYKTLHALIPQKTQSHYSFDISRPWLANMAGKVKLVRPSASFNPQAMIADLSHSMGQRLRTTFLETPHLSHASFALAGKPFALSNAWLSAHANSARHYSHVYLATDACEHIDNCFGRARIVHLAESVFSRSPSPRRRRLVLAVSPWRRAAAACMHGRG